ncbi:McrB family protein [Microbacterium flavescens]|uniref:McrB family protein n=1 Tax=Microbacterium flavescens TaxID=69366 RepID=UPI001BDF08A2|nr:AAA family ATPase [Microbacterium flavescens]
MGSGARPPEPTVVEFGQPPIEFTNDASHIVGDLMVFVMGAESSQGSSNDRGLLGVGRIAQVDRTNDLQGASARVAVRLEDVLLAHPVVTTAVMRDSPFFTASGLGEQKIFGWTGASSAQNCVPLHDRSASTDGARMAPVYVTLALMREASPGFWSDFEREYPELSQTVNALPVPLVDSSQLDLGYVPPEYRSEPIDSTLVAEYLAARGMTLHPWQVAAYLAAVRAKPFVILAGISGTGKTRVPMLVAEATGAEVEVASVRPDWTDSSELLGYTNLAGDFIPGPLMRFAASAMQAPEQQHFFVLDEMNIARTEYYLADVLSCMERRDPYGNSAPLLPSAGAADAIDYSEVVIPSNLAIIGSVNIDESTFDFSKKVLDRAFVLEFGGVDLLALQAQSATAGNQRVWYGAASWRGEPVGLANRTDQDGPAGTEALLALVELNDILRVARLDIGYRVRDEFVGFVLEAAHVGVGFADRAGNAISPLDVAVASKLLPRIQGSGHGMRSALEDLSTKLSDLGCHYSAARVGAMTERLKSDGYTSFF